MPVPVPLLALHDRPEEIEAVLRAGCPDADLRFVRSAAEVGPALAEHRPEIVFSVKHGGFPGPGHRAAVLFPTVRWFHVGGSGFDHLIPWDPARVTVTHSAGVLAPFLVETATAALLALSTGVLGYHRQQAERRWAPGRFRALAGRTAVVVGAGAVGGPMARQLRRLGLDVLVVRASGAPFEDFPTWGPSALLDLLPRADVLSLHVRLGPATHHLIGAAQLAALPAGALLLNAARGAVLDTDALVDALRRGALAGAWLDVTDPEPLPADHPLWGDPRVLITPHAADQVLDFPRRFAERFVERYARYRRQESLPDVALP